MRRTSNVLGSGEVKAPKVNIARREGMLCESCYKEKMVCPEKLRVTAPSNKPVSGEVKSPKERVVEPAAETDKEKAEKRKRWSDDGKR